MITPVVQRWRSKVGTYRLAREPIDTRLYEVASLPEERSAKAFVCEHHYSNSIPPSRFRFGLFRRSELVGVALFTWPVNDRALAPLPGSPLEGSELGRFVLRDEVEANGESWFAARCFESLRREGILGVIAFSDPMERFALDGTRTFRGHIGTVYQSLGATYLDRSKPGRIRLFPDGSVLHARTIAKIRKGERGHRYASRLLEAQGAPPLEGDPDAWLKTWLPRLTRVVLHPGNHKYVWSLDRAATRALPTSKPYPKFGDGELFSQMGLRV